jgi:hypothetical protein
MVRQEIRLQMHSFLRRTRLIVIFTTILTIRIEVKKKMLTKCAIVAVLLAFSACMSTAPSQPCGCPNTGARLALPLTLSGSVSSISADACTVLSTHPDIVVDSTTGKECKVTVLLDNGISLSAVVDFRAVGGCCTNGYQQVDGSAFKYADGGSGP